MRTLYRSRWVWLGVFLALTLPLRAADVIDFLPREIDRAETTRRLEKILEEEVRLIPLPSEMVARSRMATPDPSVVCPISPSSEDNSLSLTNLAWQQLLGLDTGAALRSLELARARLPCQYGILERDRIRELFLYEAVAYTYQGQIGQATTVMLDVAGLGLEWSPGSRFNPRVQQVWDGARAQAVKMSPTPITHESGLGRLWVDGSPAEEPLLLSPGRHVVQVVPTGGESIRTDLVEVPASATPIALESLTTFGLEPLDEHTTNWKRALITQRLDEVHVQVILQWLEEHQQTEFRWVVPGESGGVWYGHWSEAKGYGGERLPEKVAALSGGGAVRPQREMADGLRFSAGTGVVHVGLVSPGDKILVQNAMTVSVAVEQLVGPLAFGVWIDSFAGVAPAENSSECEAITDEECSCVSLVTDQGDTLVCGVDLGHPVSTAVGASGRVPFISGRLVVEAGLDLAATWMPVVISTTAEGEVLRSSRVYLGPTLHVAAGTELVPGWWLGLVTRGGVEFARTSLGLQHLSPLSATLRLGHSF